jgi:N-acetylglucosaminyldiphosphoundecaprenol N-acetyl-beta-D-mannosaminyltransferase
MQPQSLPAPAALNIRGIRLTNLAMEDALNAIDAALSSKTPMQIAFVNADCVNLAARDRAYQEALAQMDWVFVDGAGMRIAGQLLKQPVRDNVNGTDLFPQLCAELAGSGRRIYLLGAKPGVAAKAAAWAAEKFPGLVIAGTQDGYFTEADTERVIASIQAAQPDVLFVAMGAPRQEQWIRQHAAKSGALVTLGVGGLFDYYSGNIPRAPLWLRRIGMEWVFRLQQEPGRLWKRYLLGNWAFLGRITADRLRQSLAGKHK